MSFIIGTPQRLGHLPLVMDVYRRSGFPAVIDHGIKQDPRSHVCTSECVAVILCGVFVGAHSLWRLRERLAMYDMATIMQDASFDLERFPEERLAKALDQLFACGLDKIMTSIATQVLAQWRLQTDFLHFDTTTLSFYGAYEDEDTLPPGDVPPPRVTFGHSKAHRPDLKQVVFGSLVSSDGGVPLYGAIMDGNISDSVAAASFFRRIRTLVAAPQAVCCVADSKGWCASVLAVVMDEQLRLLSRLPRTHGLHAELMARSWDNPQLLTLPARGTAPADTYQWHAYDIDCTFTVIDATTADKSSTRTLQVPARAVRIYSTALLRSKLKTLTRTKAREIKAVANAMRGWQACAYACADDAQRASERHCTQATYITCDLHATIAQHHGPIVRSRGRPRQATEPAIQTDTHWRVTYHTTPTDDHVITKRLHDQACFILIRTRHPDWHISDTDMIARYKDQYHVEHGFSWLKSGALINPMFLDTPRRIAALGFIYCIGLIMWNLIQRTVRKNLTAWKKGLPYHRRKPSANITTRFLFELFPSVQTIPITHENGTTTKQLAGFTEVQQLACDALGTKNTAFQPIIPS